MIGTIRKHSKWLWWFIAGITIISFTFFMGSGPSHNRGGGSEDGSLGTIYGHAVTPQEYQQAENDFTLNYLLNNGTWPEKGHVTDLDKNRQIYGNLMLAEKAKTLGVAISDQAAVDSAANLLGSEALNRAVGNHSGKAISMDDMVNILKNHNPPLTANDYEHFVRSRMVVEQMQLSMGLAGALITPQEASSSYDHEFRTASTEAVFFSAQDYLDQVPTPSSAVGQFFTNYMADYRYPDRVQVNYVWFNITNYLAQSKAEWAKTNLEDQVTMTYNQTDPSEFGDAKTPDAAKAKIRDLLIKRRAINDAHQVSQDFVATLFAMTPLSLDNFAAVAKQKGLTVKVSEPFSSEGSEEFANAPDVAKTAFALTPESPFSDEIVGDDGIYVIGLAQQLPSSMPAFDDIKTRVTHDYQMMQAVTLARAACTNFWMTASVQSAQGKTLAQTAVAKGLTVVTPEPFSLNSQDIPEIGEHVEADTFKQVAFGIAPGHVSPLIPTRDGAFVMYVKSVSAPDAATKASQLPQYVMQLRRQREAEAFSLWANSEAGKVFPNIPILAKLMADAEKQQPQQPQ